MLGTARLRNLASCLAFISRFDDHGKVFGLEQRLVCAKTRRAEHIAVRDGSTAGANCVLSHRWPLFSIFVFAPHLQRLPVQSSMCGSGGMQALQSPGSCLS